MTTHEAGLELDARRSPVSPQDGLLSIVSDYGDDRIQPVFNDDKKMPPFSSLPEGAHDRPAEKRILGLRKATFWLSIATALALLCAIVAAGVGGSLASHRSHELQQLRQAREQLAICSPEPSSTPPQNSTPSTQTCSGGTLTTSSPEPTGSISPDSNNGTCVSTPESDCTSLSSTWTADLYSSVQFNISCSTHYTGGDLISILVYEFEDCMNACASYNTYITAHSNSNCSAVSYAPTEAPPANCFLKDATTSMGNLEAGVDSAALLQS